MSLKVQRNLGYGLAGFGISIMTGYSLSAYSQGIWFLMVVLLTAVVLGFLTLKEAVALKGINQEIPFREAVRLVGGLYGLIFAGFMVVVTLGIIKGA